MSDVREQLRRASGLVRPPEDPFDRLAKRRDRRRRRERLMAGALAMALTVGVLGGTLFALSRAGRDGGTAQPAGQGAPTVGSHQRNQGNVPSGLGLAEGQYLYVRWTNVDPGMGFVMQTWWANDGSGRVEAECTDPGCDENYGLPPEGTFGPGQFPTDSDMTGLSTNPATLLDQLLERTAPGGESPEPPVSPGPELTPGVTAGGLLYAIDSLLQDPNGSPELKAAVFEVAKGVETVQSRSGTDPVGRPAIVLDFGYGTSTFPMNYFFDPATHLLMAMASQGGAVYQVYDQGLVDSTDAVPTGDQWLFPESPPRKR